VSRRVVVFGSHSGLDIWEPSLSRIPDTEAQFIRHGSSENAGSAGSYLRSLRTIRGSARSAAAVISVSTLLGAGAAAAQRASPVIAIDVGAVRIAEAHRRLGRWSMALLLGLPRLVVGVTGAHGAALSEVRPQVTVRVVPQPIRPAGCSWQPDHDAPYVLCAGTSGRDLRTLCIAAQGLPLDVVIVDGGRELVRAGGTPVLDALPANVKRLGRVSHHAYLGLLAKASAIVLPLPYSGYPIGITVLLDAMVAGIPVVATDVPSVTDYQGEATALTVPVGDPEALAGAIRLAVEDRDRAARVGRSGQRHVERIAAPGVVAARFAEVIEEVA
jgi:glycosyltransferase involved in cell wall biosynthesis